MSSAEQIATLKYSGPDGVYFIELKGESTCIGRSAEQDLVMRESFVSRRHAVIIKFENGFEIVDQKSSHGTFLNGVRIERALLTPGDTLQFGSLSAPRLRFELGSASEHPSQSSLADDLLSALSVMIQPSQSIRPAAREMEQLSCLLNAARQLNAGGSITDIFRVLLQLSIELTGVERGFVFLREGDKMRLALGLRADGSIVEEDSTVSRRAMKKAIESESKFSVSDTLADQDAAEWASVMANSIRSIYCLPLRKHISASEPNRLLGLLYLDSQIGAGNLSEIDHEVLDTIATEAATLLDNVLLAEAEKNARLAAEQLAIAATIHSSLMSLAMPTLSYASLQAKSVPCLAIGGDFYDVVVLDDCVCAAIADISGKGVPAAIVAATLQGIIHGQMLTGQSLADIAALVNRFLCTRKVNKYATMILLKLFHDGSIEFVNCGHVPPVHVNAAGITRLEEGNLVVGLLPGATYESAHFKLAPGDRILLVTDGITEAENTLGEQFGDVGLDSIVRHSSINEILEHIARFQGPNQPDDDLTLLDVSYQP
jgi:phosphoserine phosphatase RsbU/P